MNYSDQAEVEQQARAIADELIEEERQRYQTRQTARRLLLIVRIVALVIVVATVLWVAKPFIMGNEIRDRARKYNLKSMLEELHNYKATHRGALPYEYNTRHWQDAFINSRLGSDKDFVNDPSSGERYGFVINERRTADQIKQDSDYKTVYIDQSTSCDQQGDLKTGEGASIAALRLKLESNQIYCLDNK